MAPNISGYIGYILGYGVSQDASRKALHWSGNVGVTRMQTTSEGQGSLDIEFNAGDENSIYSDATETVQPAAAQTLMIIKT